MIGDWGGDYGKVAEATLDAEEIVRLIPVCVWRDTRMTLEEIKEIRRREYLGA